MHKLVIFIFMTVEYQRSIARASGVCGPPPSPQNPNIKPVTSSQSVPYAIHEKIRFDCVDGYVRKAGTSNQIRCLEINGNATWDPKPLYPLVCIPDPRKPKKTTDPPKPELHFTSHTTEGTHTPTVRGTSKLTTAATGHKTLTATNELATTKTRTTTNLPTMKTTTKEAESPTTANEIASSTFSTSTQFMTTRSSSATRSRPVTTTAEGVSIPFNTTASSTENDQKKHFSDNHTSTIGGVAGIFIVIFLVAVLVVLWWRFKPRDRATNSTIEIHLFHTNPTTSDTYIPVPVSDSGHCSAETNTPDAAMISTTESIHDTK